MKNELSILVVNRDDNSNRRQAICDAIARAWHGACTMYQHRAVSGGWSPPVPKECKADLVLFHWSDKQALDDMPTVIAPINRASIRIAYSGGGMSRVTDLPQGWMRIPRSLDSVEYLSGSEWRELLNWAADTNRSEEI